MGNVSGRKSEGSSSGTKNEEGEEYMEYAHGRAHVSYQPHVPFPDSMVQSPPHSPRAFQSPFMFTPQVPVVPLQWPNEMMRIQSDESKQKTTEYGAMVSEKGIPTAIIWIYDGTEVEVEGSWDNWKKRELLQRSDQEFTIMKVLPSGVYHYRFIVDGQSRYAPDLPRECDDMGNVFNLLDLQDHVPEVLNNISENESPSSPISSYDNPSFSLEDCNKIPELPPLLRQTPLDQPSSSKDSPGSLDKPLCAVLNHLYVQRGRNSQSMLSLSSTQRFRTKYVTVVLYKSLKNVKK